MSKTVTIKKEYYTIDELKSMSAKDVLEKICDNNRYIDVEYSDWYEPIYEGFRESMKKYGVRVDKIYFSGFSSQGDGAIFEVKYLDIIEFLQENKLITKFKKYFNEIKKDIAQNYYGCAISKIKTEQLLEKRYLTIKHYGHYYHEKSYVTSFEYDYDFQDEFEQYLENFIEEHAKELYKSLNDYYDELTSDEYILESLANNDCMFTLTGESEK